MEPEEALDKILSDTGLKSTELPNGAYTITLASAQADGARSFRVAQADRQDSRAVETIEEDEASKDKKDVVTVVGTRIIGARPTSPVVTITQEEMRLSGQNNLGEVIRALPQNFAGGQNPGVALGATTGANIANGNVTGASGFNLRGLGPDATLTLLNGNRLPYDGFRQATDVSVIPVAAIERVEILLDGASAIMRGRSFRPASARRPMAAMIKSNSQASPGPIGSRAGFSLRAIIRKVIPSRPSIAIISTT
jgi:hypothetical protein